MLGSVQIVLTLILLIFFSLDARAQDNQITDGQSTEVIDSVEFTQLYLITLNFPETLQTSKKVEETISVETPELNEMLPEDKVEDEGIARRRFITVFRFYC